MKGHLQNTSITRASFINAPSYEAVKPTEWKKAAITECWCTVETHHPVPTVSSYSFSSSFDFFVTFVPFE